MVMELRSVGLMEHLSDEHLLVQLLNTPAPPSAHTSWMKLYDDSGRRRLDAAEAGADHRQGIGDVEKGIGLLFGQDLLDAEVAAPAASSMSKVPRPSSMSRSTSAFLKPMKFSSLGPVLLECQISKRSGSGTDCPAEHDRLEISLVDELGEK